MPSRSRLAAWASRSGVGVAAAPCTKIVMPLDTLESASVGEMARFIH
jgi:hypothetical protein